MRTLLLTLAALAFLLPPLTAQTTPGTNESSPLTQSSDSRPGWKIEFLSGADASGALGLVSFLFGAFCALWAQNTRRNAWLWFFMGLFFNVLAVIVLLIKNADATKTPDPRLFSEGRRLR